MVKGLQRDGYVQVRQLPTVGNWGRFVRDQLQRQVFVPPTYGGERYNHGLVVRLERIAESAPSQIWILVCGDPHERDRNGRPHAVNTRPVATGLAMAVGVPKGKGVHLAAVKRVAMLSEQVAA
ncbi:hypothetical protein PD653_0203 [Nocardioides sp. PD653]|nr:hypothetical protein PD653B2_0797 [Nocardioides sp. PD653-B2]GAW52810.1 hypothetical protein PD653_0203 [Nocardioides sp. PD653]